MYCFLICQPRISLLLYLLLLSLSTFDIYFWDIAHYIAFSHWLLMAWWPFHWYLLIELTAITPLRLSSPYTDYIDYYIYFITSTYYNIFIDLHFIDIFQMFHLFDYWLIKMYHFLTFHYIYYLFYCYIYLFQPDISRPMWAAFSHFLHLAAELAMLSQPQAARWFCHYFFQPASDCHFIFCPFSLRLPEPLMLHHCPRCHFAINHAISRLISGWFHIIADKMPPFSLDDVLFLRH